MNYERSHVQGVIASGTYLIVLRPRIVIKVQNLTQVPR